MNSFFKSYLENNNLAKHDGRPLWKHNLSDEDFETLRNVLQQSKPYYMDTRDFALYYSEWWKKKYNGGSPSKKEIFDSIGGNIKFYFNYKEFFKLAKKGAQILGIKWITKQNTLYFRTLLLQGGLPLLHISENQGKYQNFLLAVLEEQPDTIEDFMFKPHITKYLPISSQNEIIYESCFEIVKSILNDENIYDDLLESSEALISITNTLKVRKQHLERRQRLSKPKNYWLLSTKKDNISIRQRIGLADIYNSESLTNILGFNATSGEYQFYLNEELICVFRKMINGNYKTDWHQQQNQKWNGDSNLPYSYVIVSGEKIEVKDFIQTIPNLEDPSLWVKYSDHEWRLLKGSGTSNKEAVLLFPNHWSSDSVSTEIMVNNTPLSWLTFEGEVEINSAVESRRYLSEVNSFDWTILSQKPHWIIKANMPVVQKKPTVLIYDENDKILPDGRFKIWIKQHKSIGVWQELSLLSEIPLGCLIIKIEKDGLIAYDTFFNVGKLQTRDTHKAVDNAIIEIRNKYPFEFKLDESAILEIQNCDDSFSLKLNTKYAKIPTSIKGSVGHRNQKKLFFEMVSPFEGMTIISGDGSIIDENLQLSLMNLYGLRILCTPDKGTILRIKNGLNPDVIISKEIKVSSQPLISFKDEILRLFYLSDAMDYRNKVRLELVEGRNSKTYEFAGFSHSLNVEEQFNNNISLHNSSDELELFAIPLNCESENIELIPLVRNELSYTIPSIEITNQFIVISSKEDENQLMPRFVNTDESFIGNDKEDRIENYHLQLSHDSFENESWKQLLSYFNICIENSIPSSTFDQIRAISRSSHVAARAFFLLGANYLDKNTFIQEIIPDLEKDLGFCFHWIKKDDWTSALDEISDFYGTQYFNDFITLISLHMQEIGLQELLQYINDASIRTERIHNTDISNLRARLGARVLKELPQWSPKITKEYNIHINEHFPVKLLLRSPIAVAESISDSQYDHPIWGGNDIREVIRRNIQYCQYLDSKFYNKAILHTLKMS